MSNPDRQCKLDVELPSKAQIKFESKYNSLTGIKPQPDNHNYYVLHAAADKWGEELRIYFNAAVSNIPPAIENLVVKPRPSTSYNCRINNNAFIWQLIERGFLLADTQDVNRIRSKVPPEFVADFERGFSRS